MELKFRDPLSGLTHFLGALLAVAGLVLLLNHRNSHLTAYHTVSVVTFGAAMILLYTFSTLYHWLPLQGRKLEVFRKIDHIMIFVFIAASYTPICLITLKPSFWGMPVFYIVWGVTLAGFFMKLFWLQAPRILYTLIYILMGWIIVICIVPLVRLMPTGALYMLGLGGVFYTTGAVMYAIKKPNPWPGTFGFHEIFHIFIMLGTLSHYLMVYYFII